MPLEDSVSLYEDVEELDEDLTNLLKITFNRKNAETIDRAARPLGNAATKVAMKQGKIAQKDLMAIAQSKQMHDLVKFAETLDPNVNIRVRKDLMAIDEQMLRLGAEGIKVHRRGTESHANGYLAERAFNNGADLWVQGDNEDVAAFDREFGQEIQVEMAIMEKPWAKALMVKMQNVVKSAQFQNFEKHQKAFAGDNEMKNLNTEWKKYINVIGHNIKVEDMPKDILNYNMVKCFNRFMSVTDSLLHGEFTEAFAKDVAKMKVYT